MCLSVWPALSHSFPQQPNEEGAILQIRKMRLIYMKHLACGPSKRCEYLSSFLAHNTNLTEPLLLWDLSLPDSKAWHHLLLDEGSHLISLNLSFLIG